MEFMEVQYTKKSRKCTGRSVLVVAILLAVVGVACLIAGVVLITKSQDEATQDQAKQQKQQGNTTPLPTTLRPETELSTSLPTSPPTSPQTEPQNNSTGNKTTPLPTCSYSEEAQRVGFGQFLLKVQESYYNLQPHLIASKPNVQASEIREKFLSYDPSPAKIKERTDKAWELLKEINNKDIKVYQMKPRERKSLSQVKHFLQHVFGSPYDENYYAGDFLLGPNYFCWQPICDVLYYLETSMRVFQPANVTEVEVLMKKLESVNRTFSTYIENLKYGVKAGMVRSLKECEAGITTFKNKYWSVSTKGPEGILEKLKDMFEPAFLKITADQDQSKAWLDKYKVPVNESLRTHVLDNVGRPLNQLIRFLETEYIEHCVPSFVSSGLATLPLAHIYVNGTAVPKSTTTKKLPGGEPLNGTYAYQQIMSYFTTTNITAKEVHQLGYKMISELYPEILKIAREESGHANDTLAKQVFKERLNASDMYFAGSRKIPVNESNGDAHTKCRTEKDAKLYCPVRWSVMKDWFKEVNQVMSLLDPKTVHMFYFTGKNDSTPNCPINVKPNFNPAAGVPSYRPSDKACSRAASYIIPFFLNRPGPRFTQWSVNSHEARPGHHTQVQGAQELFQDTCGGLIGWLDSITSYTAFIEGWGLYAETLIAKDTDTYEGEPLYKYGMLRSQLWRALRLVVDTGLHYEGFSRQKALNFFVNYVWEDSDVVQKEITRYQSDPGQATAYMVGQLHIAMLRKHAQTQLGKKFNLKEFHYHLLKQGSAPLSYLTDAIGEYIRCTKNKDGDGCQYVLNSGKERDGEGHVHTNTHADNVEYYF